ncbi:MAG TPA: hypothetical protein VK302_00890, partial [Terriglobales bacterium]|nr:hypothetical protein [Terriglobales bacterium]
RVKERLCGNYCNRMKWNGAALKCPNALHHLGVGAPARTVLSVGIVDRRRPIHAHPDVYAPVVKKITPLIVNEHSVRLEGMTY